MHATVPKREARQMVHRKMKNMKLILRTSGNFKKENLNQFTTHSAKQTPKSYWTKTSAIVQSSVVHSTHYTKVTSNY